MIWLTGALAVLTLVATYGYLAERARRKQRTAVLRLPIRSAQLEELDPVFRSGAHGPALDAQVTFIGGADVTSIVGATSDAEAWILAALSKRAMLMFEFGTATGRTAYLWAVNSPPDARVVTLTLPPSGVAGYRRERGDARTDTRHALQESRFTSFYYTGTDVERKVTQLYGDSKALDESPWAGQCDLVFVDGSHALSFVKSDSEKALRLVRPGGLVLWHDYRGRRIPGVYEALNGLARELPLMHIANTSFVAYRKPR